MHEKVFNYDSENALEREKSFLKPSQGIIN